MIAQLVKQANTASSSTHFTAHMADTLALGSCCSDQPDMLHNIVLFILREVPLLLPRGANKLQAYQSNDELLPWTFLTLVRFRSSRKNTSNKYSSLIKASPASVASDAWAGLIQNSPMADFAPGCLGVQHRSAGACSLEL